MFYKNIKLKKPVSKAKINFTQFSNSMDTEIDDAIMPYKTAKMSYNFNVKKGCLKNGNGFKDFTMPSLSNSSDRTIVPPNGTIKKLWHYKYFNTTQNTSNNQILIYTDDGQIYSSNVKSNTPLCARVLSSVFSSGVPNAVNYRLNSKDTMIFSSETDGMWKYTQNEVASEIENAPFIKSMCLHYERLFAVVGGQRNRLAFSANLDPTDWSSDLSSGGFIDMQDERGPLSKVISYNDYVYVFRDYGVARVSAYGDQSDFSVSQLFTSSVKLYGDTVTLCGNKVLLLAKDGIHQFDGYATRKLNLGIDSLFDGVQNENACGLYFNNKFYLACRLNFNDNKAVGCESYVGGYTNNALLELDLTTNELSITRGVDISSMLAVDEENFCKMLVTFNGQYSGHIGELTNDGKLFGEVLPKRWQSPKSNMGFPCKIKHIEECLIKTNSTCLVTIKTDRQEKQFTIHAKPVSQRIKLNITGEQIQVGFDVTEDGETEISCPQIIVGVSN